MNLKGKRLVHSYTQGCVPSKSVFYHSQGSKSERENERTSAVKIDCNCHVTCSILKEFFTRVLFFPPLLLGISFDPHLVTLKHLPLWMFFHLHCIKFAKLDALVNWDAFLGYSGDEPVTRVSVTASEEDEEDEVDEGEGERESIDTVCSEAKEKEGHILWKERKRCRSM